MFAVIKTGGKQYKVASGDVIAVEKLAGEPGSGVELEQVLMIGDGPTMTVGKPFVAGAAVGATVVEQTRGEKIIIFKKKRRQNYRRRNGHRQDLTVLKITDIYPAGATRKPKVVVEAKPAAKEAKEAAHPAKKAAHKPAAKKEAAHKERAKKPAAKAKKESSAKGKAGKSKEK